MALIKNTITDFSEGLINTRVDVPGSLIRAEDCNFGLGGVRQRGPITRISTIETGIGTTYQKTCALNVNRDLMLAAHTSSLATSVVLYDSDDAGATWIESAAGATISTTYGDAILYGGAQVVALGDELIVGGSVESNWYLPDVAGSGSGVYRYGGSQMSSLSYTTGTITATTGSDVITGAGTTWTSDHVGAYFIYGTNAYRWQRIKSVDSATQITLDGPAQSATVAGASYAIHKFGPFSANFAGPNSTIKYGVNAASEPTVFARCIGVHQGRLFLGGVVHHPFSGTASTAKNIVSGSTIRWSALVGESIWVDTFSTFGTTGAGGSHRLAYEEIGPGIGGDIVGLQSLDRYLVVLKDGAVFVCNGAFDTSNENSSFAVSRIPGAPGCVGVQASAVGAFGVAYMSQRGLMIFDGAEVRNVSAGRINDIDFRDLANQYCVVSAVGNRIIVHEAINGDEAQQMIYVYDTVNDAWSYSKSKRLFSAVVEDSENKRELSMMHDVTNADIVLANHATEIDETFIVGTEDRDLDEATVTPNMLICTSAIPLGDEQHAMGRPKYVDLEFGGLPVGFTQGYINVTVYVGSRTADFSTDSLPPNPIDLHNYAIYNGSFPLDTQLYSGERSVARVRLFPSAGDMDGVGPQYAASCGAYGFVEVKLLTSGGASVGTPWHLVGLSLYSAPVRRQAGGAV